MITCINRQHPHHVYEQQQQSDTSSGHPSGNMDAAGAHEINEPYEDDFAAQAK